MNEYLFVNSIRSSFDLLCATSSALHQYTETVSECLNPFLARIFFMRCLVFMCSHFFFKSIPKIEFLLKYSIHFSFTPSLSSSSQSNVYHPFFVRFCFDSNMLSWFHSTGNVMARACVCYISSLFCNWNQRSCELLKTECQLTIETKKNPAIIRRLLLFLCFVAVLRLEMWNWNKIQLQHLRAHMCGAKCFICWV